MKKPLILFAAFLVLFSCSTDDSDNSNAPQSSFCDTTFPFIKEGRTLTYNFGTFGTQTAFGTIKIGSCINEEGFEVERDIPLGTGIDIWRQNGEFLEIDSNGDGDYWVKAYKKNPTLGETWEFPQPDGDIVTYKVISVDSTITVPAGTYTCKVLSYTNTGIINTTYIFWDDEIGQVKATGFGAYELESVVEE
mgnify:CR=1 FL=1